MRITIESMIAFLYSNPPSSLRILLRKFILKKQIPKEKVWVTGENHSERISKVNIHYIKPKFICKKMKANVSLTEICTSMETSNTKILWLPPQQF